MRPLSARSLPESLAEREGWVNRDEMYDLDVESREHLNEIARELGIDTHGFPAEDRCKLVIPYFGQRLENLLAEDHLTLNGLELLEFPLYYKSPPDVKIVLGRDDEEKRKLQNFFLPSDLRLYVPVNDGPIALVRANWDGKSENEILDIIQLAAKITAMHALPDEQKQSRRVQASYRFEDSQETRRINISPFSSEQELSQHCMKLDF